MKSCIQGPLACQRMCYLHFTSYMVKIFSNLKPFYNLDFYTTSTLFYCIDMTMEHHLKLQNFVLYIWEQNANPKAQNPWFIYTDLILLFIMFCLQLLLVQNTKLIQFYFMPFDHNLPRLVVSCDTWPQIFLLDLFQPYEGPQNIIFWSNQPPLDLLYKPNGMPVTLVKGFKIWFNFSLVTL